MLNLSTVATPVVILAGGKGLRMSSDVTSKSAPKPAVLLGQRPLVWHVIQSFLRWGPRDIFLCLGHKADAVRRALAKAEVGHLLKFIDQGTDLDTGTRVIAAIESLNCQSSWVTYCDGLFDFDPFVVEAQFDSQASAAMAVAVQPFDQYGVFQLAGGRPVDFIEKPKRNDWISAGAFIINKAAFDKFREDSGSNTSLEKEIIPSLVRAGQMDLFFHKGNFKSVDTLKDLVEAEELLKTNPFWIKSK